jgi:hypothetical protein
MPELISTKFRVELEEYLQDVAKFAKRVGKNELFYKTSAIFDKLQGDCKTVDNTEKK